MNGIDSTICYSCKNPLPEISTQIPMNGKFFSFCNESCHTLLQKVREASKTDATQKVEQVKESVLPSKTGFDFCGMDTDVNPGDDFFRYAGGRWIDKLQIPDGYPSWGSYHLLNQKLDHDLLSLLNQISEPENKIEFLVHAYYQSAMNIHQQNELGLFPILELFDQIRAIKSQEDFFYQVCTLHLLGVPSLFNFSVDPNPVNSRIHLLKFRDGGLGLPDFEMYLKEKDTSVNNHAQKREKYKEFLKDLFVKCSFDESEAMSASHAVMEMEIELASYFLSKEEKRDPIKTTNVFKIDTEKFAHVFWQILFTCWNIDIQEINFENPQYFSSLFKWLDNLSIEKLKYFLTARVMCSLAPYLGSEFFNLDFEFYQKELKGIQSPRPLQERMMKLTSYCLADAVGKLYVERYFPKEKKEKVVEMIQRIKDAFIKRIQNLNWMQEQTRAKAIEKVRGMEVLIGFPDEDLWDDYSSLDTLSAKVPLVTNRNFAVSHSIKAELKKIATEVNKKKWFCSPQTFNAYNVPEENKIVFPAGILGFPFLTDDDAVTWGAFGMVAAHEIIHSFDDEGRQYDVNGALKDWWLPEDAKYYEEHAKIIKEQFNDYALQFSDGTSMQVNGALCLGENIADLGGLIMAFDAMKQSGPLPAIDGWTPEQRFFLGYAQVWRSKCRDEFAKRLLSSDPHSPAKWRVNGTLSQLEEFRKAFSLPKNCPMVIPEEKRSRMWG